MAALEELWEMYALTVLSTFAGYRSHSGWDGSA